MQRPLPGPRMPSWGLGQLLCFKLSKNWASSLRGAEALLSAMIPSTPVSPHTVGSTRAEAVCVVHL